MSEQQKLYKKSIKTLRNTEDQEVLKENKPKPRNLMWSDKYCSFNLLFYRTDIE